MADVNHSSSAREQQAAAQKETSEREDLVMFLTRVSRQLSRLSLILFVTAGVSRSIIYTAMYWQSIARSIDASWRRQG